MKAARTIPPLTEKHKTRFWSRIKKGTNEECWPWMAARSGHGYGQIRLSKKALYTSSRVAFTLENGPIPDGLQVLHRCDNPPCCNPNHLFLGTAKDNAKDMVSKNRHAAVTKPDSVARGDRNGKRTHPEKVQRGKEIWTCKINEALALEIRRRYLGEKSSSVKMGREYGLHSSTIRRIAYSKTWTHI